MDMLVNLLDMTVCRNPGDRILEFGDATEMVVGNTLKRDGRLVTYQAGKRA